jgi:hypothetical protein
MALFKNGELVHMLERHHIEGRPAEMIAENLMLTTNTANPVKIIFQTTLSGVVFLFKLSNPNCHSDEGRTKQFE